jgi:hypothetical protein
LHSEGRYDYRTALSPSLAFTIFTPVTLAEAIAMERVRLVAEFLCRLNVEAFVSSSDDRIIIELRPDEFHRCKKILCAWFKPLDISSQSVRLVERLRGSIDDTTVVSASHKYSMN